MKLHNFSLSVVLVTFLFACGGGGNSSPTSQNQQDDKVSTSQNQQDDKVTRTTLSPVVISQSNEESVTETAVSSISDNFAVGFADAFSGVVNAEQYNRFYGFTPNDIIKIVENVKVSQDSFTGAVNVEVENCSGGGTITTTTNVSGVVNISVNDSVLAVHNRCVDDDGIETSGSIKITFVRYNTSLFFTVNLEVIDFTASAFDISSSVNGVMKMAIDNRSDNRSIITSDNLLSEIESEFELLENFTLTTVIDQVTNERSVLFQGKVSDTDINGSLNITTNNPFKFKRFSSSPYSGRLVAIGADNSKVTINVISENDVEVELDSNGDGITDSSTTYDWFSL